MKYSIMRDLVDDTYWIVDRANERADEIKVYESDSIYDCILHLRYKLNDAKENFEVHEEICIVFWAESLNDYTIAIYNSNKKQAFYFIGSREECNKWIKEHALGN